jgi:uncharacterized phiE125 gp8 family phage protein
MKVIVQPALEPISIADVKLQIAIKADDNTQDDLIRRRIKEAREFAESYMQRAILKRTLEVRFDSFSTKPMRLPYPNLIAVNSVKYIDEAGTLQTLDPSFYSVDDYGFVGSISLAFDKSWPAVRAELNAVRIQYDCGYGTKASDVPELIKEALLLIVGNWMNFQPQAESGVSVSRLPFAVRDMLDQFSVRSLG